MSSDVRLNSIVLTRFALRYANTGAALHATNVAEIQLIELQQANE